MTRVVATGRPPVRRMVSPVARRASSAEIQFYPTRSFEMHRFKDRTIDHLANVENSSPIHLWIDPRNSIKTDDPQSRPGRDRESSSKSGERTARTDSLGLYREKNSDSTIGFSHRISRTRCVRRNGRGDPGENRRRCAIFFERRLAILGQSPYQQSTLGLALADAMAVRTRPSGRITRRGRREHTCRRGCITKRRSVLIFRRVHVRSGSSAFGPAGAPRKLRSSLRMQYP